MGCPIWEPFYLKTVDLWFDKYWNVTGASRSKLAILLPFFFSWKLPLKGDMKLHKCLAQALEQFKRCKVSLARMLSKDTLLIEFCHISERNGVRVFCGTQQDSFFLSIYFHPLKYIFLKWKIWTTKFKPFINCFQVLSSAIVLLQQCGTGSTK